MSISLLPFFNSALNTWSASLYVATLTISRLACAPQRTAFLKGYGGTTLLTVGRRAKAGRLSAARTARSGSQAANVQAATHNFDLGTPLDYTRRA